jgi:hypothetical protein
MTDEEKKAEEKKAEKKRALAREFWDNWSAQRKNIIW